MTTTKPRPPAEKLTVESLTLWEIDQWEEATGLTFTEARQMQQVTAALWTQARRDGRDVTPDQLMRETKVGQIADFISTPGPVAVDPTPPATGLPM